MSVNSNKQLISTTTLFQSLHISSWIMLIISFALIFAIVVLILIVILCLCNCFPRLRFKNRAYFTSTDAKVYNKYHSSLSVNKKSLSFDHSEHIINMTPLECGMITPSNFCEKEIGDLSLIRQHFSRICHWFSMKEIIEATDNFHSRNLIGVGCYGNVYRGVLLNGARVAVKELTLNSLKAEQFRRMVAEIPQMTHKNLVNVIGFCVEEWDLSTRYILVCEYVDNGNLHQWLHAEDAASVRPLTWKFRMDIITGIAKGLAYLHEDVGQKIVHGHLQSHKILFDHQWNPKISDFVVARLLNHTSFYSNEELNEKDDVFSFGLLVIEIVSGKKLNENNRYQTEQQVIWLKSMILNRNYEQVVDPKVPQLPPFKELKRVLLIALRCADLDTEKRPKMGEVLHMFEPRDLLLSDGQDFFRRSFFQDDQVFSDQMSIEDHVLDYDLGDKRHS